MLAMKKSRRACPSRAERERGATSVLDNYIGNWEGSVMEESGRVLGTVLLCYSSVNKEEGSGAGHAACMKKKKRRESEGCQMLLLSCCMQLVPLYSLACGLRSPMRSRGANLWLYCGMGRMSHGNLPCSCLYPIDYRGHVKLDNWLSVLLGCPFSWSSMGPFCILVLCMVGDDWPYCWNWDTGLCGITDTANYHFTMYRHKQRWWLLCSSWNISCNVVGGVVIVIMLPLVALSTQPASYVFGHFETAPASTGIRSKGYAIILSFLVSQYSLYGYDAAAHLTEETKGADKNGPIAILSSIGIISVFGWAYILSLTFSIQNFDYLFDVNNETAGTFAPAQILYDAFHGKYNSSTGAIVLLFVIWGSFFFGGLSITTSAARVVYALSRDQGVPFSSLWCKVHPKHKVPANAVWLCAAICILLGLPILKVNVVFTAITSICTVGWVGGYAIPIFARMVMAEKNFKPGPFYLGRASTPICLVAFLWICYTCSVFLLPTSYPIKFETFNYAPIGLGVCLSVIMLWWIMDARKWFKGPVRNLNDQSGKV